MLFSKQYENRFIVLYILYALFPSNMRIFAVISSKPTKKNECNKGNRKNSKRIVSKMDRRKSQRLTLHFFTN